MPVHVTHVFLIQAHSDTQENDIRKHDTKLPSTKYNYSTRNEITTKLLLVHNKSQVLRQQSTYKDVDYPKQMSDLTQPRMVCYLQWYL